MESGMFKTRIKRLITGKLCSGGIIETDEESARFVIEEIAGQLENGQMTEAARLYLASRLSHFLQTGGTLDEAFFLKKQQPRGNPGVGNDTEFARAVCHAYLGGLTYMVHCGDDRTTDAERYRAAEIAAYDEWRRLKPPQTRRSKKARVAFNDVEEEGAGDDNGAVKADERAKFIRSTVLPRLMEWLPDDPRWKGVRRVKFK